MTLDDLVTGTHSREATSCPFSNVAARLEEELRLLENIDGDVGAWEAAYGNVRSKARLCYPEGTPVPEFLLHIRGEGAWRRWSYEPFAQIDTES